MENFFKKHTILIGDDGKRDRVDTIGKLIVLGCMVVSIVLIVYGILVYVNA